MHGNVVVGPGVTLVAVPAADVLAGAEASGSVTGSVLGPMVGSVAL
jgi:hypothetical protein